MVFDRQTQLGLIRGILAEPDAEAPRQIYADWLEEQGDPLGELARVRSEMGRSVLPRARRRDLERRQAELLSGFGFDRPARAPDDSNRPVCPDWSFGIDGLVTLFIHRLPPHGDVPVPPREWLERFGWFRICVEAPDPDDYTFSVRDKGVRALLASPLMEHRRHRRRGADRPGGVPTAGRPRPGVEPGRQSRGAGAGAAPSAWPWRRRA